MADAVGQILAFGLGVGLSPIPIIAVVLMLGTPRARVNGPAFVLGWIVGLGLVGTIILLVAGGAGATEGDEPSTWVSVLMLVLGAVLVFVAVRQWRGRPRGGKEAATPSWMRTIDHFTPVRSVAIAFALSALNPKNLLLTVGAAAAIAQTGADPSQEAFALAVFVLIGSLGTAVPVAFYFALGDRATRMLEDVKTWMAANNATIGRYLPGARRQADRRRDQRTRMTAPSDRGRHRLSGPEVPSPVAGDPPSPAARVGCLG